MARGSSVADNVVSVDVLGADSLAATVFVPESEDVRLVRGARDDVTTFNVADELMIRPVLSQAFTNKTCVPDFIVR